VVELLEKRLGSTSFKVIKNVAVRGGELDAVEVLQLAQQVRGQG
jgi:hypothetical protein